MFEPTNEQTLIVDRAQNSSGNLLVRALAGTGKTSTLELITKALPSTSILCLAFNRRIKDEMIARFPSNCTVKTMNGLGHGAASKLLGGRLILDDDKVYKIYKEIVDKLDRHDKAALGEFAGETLKAIRQGKQDGYAPLINSMVKPIIDFDTLLARLDEEPTDLQISIIKEVSERSFRLCLEKNTFDFNDQILFPCVMPVRFDSPDLCLVDEAQDLSPLNHIMLQKLRAKRIIAVGDPNQAIYGFRGADENSMDNLKKMFSMDEYSITIAFRCPQAVVKEARSRAPDMTWPDWARVGLVQRLQEWKLEDIKNDAAIICRNNAPLFRLAFDLLAAGRYPELFGSDVIKGISTFFSRLGEGYITQATVFQRIEEWATKERVRVRTKSSLEDKIECLQVVAEQGATLNEILAWIETLQKQKGRIKLMTGHKSKGLEFEQVYFLDAQLISDKGQDPNIRYVIQTRAKDTLTYIQTGGRE